MKTNISSSFSEFDVARVPGMRPTIGGRAESSSPVVRCARRRTTDFSRSRWISAREADSSYLRLRAARLRAPFELRLDDSRRSAEAARRFPPFDEERSIRLRLLERSFSLRRVSFDRVSDLRKRDTESRFLPRARDDEDRRLKREASRSADLRAANERRRG
jgi:hypothetical protein